MLNKTVAVVKNPLPRRSQPKMTPRDKAIAEGKAKRKQHQQKNKK